MAVEGEKPPEHIPPDELWRGLVDGWPRPTLQIAHRIPGAEHIGLSVRALRSSEYVVLPQGWPDLPAALIASALRLDTGAPAFNDANQVLVLPEGELLALAVAVREVLHRISPTAALSNVAAWEECLARGCETPANFYDAWSLGGCVDVSWGMGRKAVHVTYHPERWFGVPQRELIDCHWIAYFAAMRMRRKLDSKT